MSGLEKENVYYSLASVGIVVAKSNVCKLVDGAIEWNDVTSNVILIQLRDLVYLTLHLYIISFSLYNKH